jgi:murein DD-endopeptidase MepM/ murein hydrolase activator NlpD/fructose-1,6-bisphosphatase/inositol monophosphatase family enzyme
MVNYTPENKGSYYIRFYGEMANGERGSCKQVYLTVNKREAEVTGLSTTATEMEQGDSVSYTVTTDLDTVSLRMYMTLIGQKLSSYSVLTETSDGVSRVQSGENYIWTVEYTPENAGNYYVRFYGEMANGERGGHKQVFLTVNKKAAEVTGLSKTTSEMEQGDSVTYTITTDLDTETLRMYITPIGQKLGSYSELTEESQGVSRVQSGDSYIWTIEYTPLKYGGFYIRFYGEMANGERGNCKQVYLTVNKKAAEVTGLSKTTSEMEQGDSVTYTITTDLDTETLRMYVTLIGQKLGNYTALTEESQGVSRVQSGESYIWTIDYTSSVTGEYYIRFYGEMANGVRGSAHKQCFLTINIKEAKIVSVSSDNSELNQGETVTFTVKTNSNTEKVRMYYSETWLPLYHYVTFDATDSGVTRVADGEDYIWTISYKTNYGGEFYFRFYGINEYGLKCSSHKQVFLTIIPEKAEVKTIYTKYDQYLVNTSVEIKIVTDSNVDKIALYDNSTFLKTVLRSNASVVYNKNHTATWTFTITMKNTGNRTLKIKAHNLSNYGDLSSSGIKIMNPLYTGFILPTSGYITAIDKPGSHAGGRALDIANDTGTAIYASASGTVVRAGIYDEYGQTDGYGVAVVIDHGNGYLTMYGHCSSVTVTEGQKVVQGQKIANMGSTGWSTGPHLHLEIQFNGERQIITNYFTNLYMWKYVTAKTR